jgi:hypothetical protein
MIFPPQCIKARPVLKVSCFFSFLEKANCASERISQFVMSQDFAVDVKQLIADRDAGKRQPEGVAGGFSHANKRLRSALEANPSSVIECVVPKSRCRRPGERKHKGRAKQKR